MLSLLPDYADPRRLCALGKVYEGTLPLADMPRLEPLLAAQDGEASFRLVFDTDAEGRATVRVAVRATLPLQCQRCLGGLRHDVAVQTILEIVSGPDEAGRLPDDVDPLLVGEGMLALRSLVEDELILAIPPAPAHRPADCAVDLGDINSAGYAEPGSDAAQAAKPFAALADLKSDKNKKD